MSARKYKKQLLRRLRRNFVTKTMSFTITACVGDALQALQAFEERLAVLLANRDLQDLDSEVTA